MNEPLPPLTDDERECFINLVDSMLKRIRRQAKKDYERKNKIQVLTGEWITVKELERRLKSFNKRK